MSTNLGTTISIGPVGSLIFNISRAHLVLPNDVGNSNDIKNINNINEDFYFNLNKYREFELSKNSDFSLVALLGFVPRWKGKRALDRNEDDYVICYFEKIKDWERDEKISDYRKHLLESIKALLFKISNIRSKLKTGITIEESLMIGKYKKTVRSMMVDYAIDINGLSDFSRYFAKAA